MVPTDKVIFKDLKDWKDYVKDIRLEITCGEAPYLIGNADVATDKVKPLIGEPGTLRTKLLTSIIPIRYV